MVRGVDCLVYMEWLKLRMFEDFVMKFSFRFSMLISATIGIHDYVVLIGAGSNVHNSQLRAIVRSNAGFLQKHTTFVQSITIMNIISDTSWPP